MSSEQTRGGVSLREAGVLWLMWGVVSGLTWITYARLPATDFYNVSGSGVIGGSSRVLVLLGWPISLAAPALLAVAVDRMLSSGPAPRPRRWLIGVAAVSVALCATIGWPGVITQSNLDAKWSNALAGCGVALAVAITVFVLHRYGLGPRLPVTAGDIVAIVLIAMMFVGSLPWIFANVGVYVGDVPGLSAVFMSKQVLPEPGHPHLHAVHLGHHDGLDGWLLAVTALGLRRALRSMRATLLRTGLALWLALLLSYGLMVGLSDFWDEQLVKRGTTSFEVPGVAMPALTWGWAFVLAATVALYLTAFRREPQPRDVDRSSRVGGHVEN